MTDTKVNANGPRGTRRRRNAVIGLLLAGLFASTLLLYSPGWSGGWHFDDYPSLQGLQDVDDLFSLLAFTTDGIAGPLKRPIALLTFALQNDSWPDSPRNFIIVNSFIHGINGLLVFLISSLLLQHIAPKSNRNVWLALIVSAAWSFSPFLASSSLMVVQRMTTLSATFLFAGLAIYLYGRWKTKTQPQLGLWVAFIGLVLFTFLSMLAKENGALLPVLALVCEVTILRKSKQDLPSIPIWCSFFFLLLPAIFVILLILYFGINSSGYEFRDFTVHERVLTQTRIIWDYFFNLLIPSQSSMTPYMDAFKVSKTVFSPVSTLLAMLGIFGGLFIALYSFRKVPVIAFGIFWFTSGHLIESTTIPLELYFAHRNYVPAFGLFFGMVYLTSRIVPGTWSRLPLISIPTVYISCSAFVLLSGTTLWGQPGLAAHVWHQQNPNSLRATYGLVAHYRSTGDKEEAGRLITEALEIDPFNQMLRALDLNYCPNGEEEFKQKWESALSALKPPRVIQFNTAILLNQFATRREHSNCPFFDQSKVVALIRLSLIESDRHRSLDVTKYLFYSLAHLMQSSGCYSEMRRYLEFALNLDSDAETAILIAYSMILEGNKHEAERYLREQLESPPNGFLSRIVWKSSLTKYLEAISD